MDRERIGRTVREIVGYDFGGSAAALFAVDQLINQSHSDAEARGHIEQALAKVLESRASLAAKQEVCRRLWRIGSDASLGALGRLLGADDIRLVEAACFAIGRRPSARADEMLRTALRNAPAACRPPIEHLVEDRR